MDAFSGSSPDRLTGPHPFRWSGLLLWIAAGVAAGAPVAWLADAARNEWRLGFLVIFPLVVGVGLGAAVVGLVRLTQTAHRPTVLAGTLLGVAVVVAGQHYLAYRARVDQWRHSSLDPVLVEKARRALPGLVEGRVPRPPEGFWAFMQQQAEQGRPLAFGYKVHGVGAWLFWGFDALLVLAATMAMVLPALGLPYCDRCRTWYRTVRTGRPSGPLAGRLAELAGVDPADVPARGRCRLQSCHWGCGPARLEFFWEDAGGRLHAAEAWLDRDRRNEVMDALDRAVEATQSA